MCRRELHSCDGGTSEAGYCDIAPFEKTSLMGLGTQKHQTLPVMKRRCGGASEWCIYCHQTNIIWRRDTGNNRGRYCQRLREEDCHVELMASDKKTVTCVCVCVALLSVLHYGDLWPCWDLPGQESTSLCRAVKLYLVTGSGWSHRGRAHVRSEWLSKRVKTSSSFLCLLLFWYYTC